MQHGHDEAAEHALTELRDGIDSLKQQNDAQRRDGGIDTQADEEELVEAAATYHRGQAEEDAFDEEMDLEEADIEEGAPIEQQGKGAEVEKATAKEP